MITLTHLIIVVISFLLGGFFNSEQDTIREFIEQKGNSKRKPGFIFLFKKFFIKWNFWITIKSNKEVNFISRYIVYFRDGWHCTKAIKLSFYFVAPTILICVYFNLDSWYWYLIINQIPLPFIRGVAFEVFYEN